MMRRLHLAAVVVVLGVVLAIAVPAGGSTASPLGGPPPAGVEGGHAGPGRLTSLQHHLSLPAIGEQLRKGNDLRGLVASRAQLWVIVLAVLLLVGARRVPDTRLRLSGVRLRAPPVVVQLPV